MRAWENATRAQTDFARTATSETALGADPYRVVSLSGSRFAGLLRGRGAIVELDASMHEIVRLAAPESPTGLAVTRAGEVLVEGELSNRVARYGLAGGKLEPRGSIELPGARAMRDVAVGPEGTVYVVEEHDGRLITFRAPPSRGGPSGALPPVDREDTPLCHGPVRVLRVAGTVLVDCLLDHAIVLRPVDARGYPHGRGGDKDQGEDNGNGGDGEVRIVHDGPMWGMDALPDGDGLLVAVGGVEDHPLDRTQGSFGFIDSFVTLYRVAGGRAAKLSEVNTSAVGVVTPKALRLSRTDAGAVELAAAAYGSDRLALVRWEGAGKGSFDDPVIQTRAVPPGTAALERLPDHSLVFANTLMDAWVHASPEGNAVVPVDDAAPSPRSADSRLGEALFFTTLMAPWDRSDGQLSRFTCETCHFEGYVDGRVHFTGRGDVHATTKPLLGLFNNRPHFSRALDPDLTTMVNSEFRVAGARSEHDPWFSLPVSDFPWVERLSAGRETLGPEDLRRALMAFFMDFTPRPNPSVVVRHAARDPVAGATGGRFSDLERMGAAVFRDRCESCHEARLVTDDPATRIPFDRWEDLVMSREGPIVWAHPGYEKTGVVPYVNEKGARVVSLRRLYKKYPYFTNGTARSLAMVLDRVRLTPTQFFHDGAPEGASPLADDEKSALAAFLDLL